MRNLYIATFFSLILLISGCEKVIQVPEPELSITVSADKLKFGEEFTISWEAQNASYTNNNFWQSNHETKGVYSEKLIESKTFWVQAFNEDEVSVLRKVDVTVEPNENDLEVILLKYKWTLTNVDGDYVDSLGNHRWVPYTIPDRNFIFYPTGKYNVVNMCNTIVGGGDSYTWKLDKDKMVLTLSGKEHKVLSLNKEKMELYALITVHYFRDTYRADPRP